MNQQISLAEAQALIKNLKDNPVNGVPVSEEFGLEIVNAVLGQDGCTSLRIYYGKKEDGSVCAILVGSTGETDLTDTIGEDGFRCPPLCPPASLLNP